MRYTINLEVRTATMFATVMALVESNPEIKVLKGELVLEERAKAKKTTQHRSVEGRFEDEFGKWVQANYQVGDLVTSLAASEWCTKNGYAASSGSSLTSLAVKRGYIEKTDRRGVFKVRSPA